MTFDWHDFLTLAESLASDPHEAAHRTAISRAYFAAYNHAFEYATAYLRFVPRNISDDHGRLREHLIRSRRRKVAEMLRDMRDRRNQADYRAEFPDDFPETVATTLLDARYVFNSLPKPSTPPS